jgi:hypothetical protein
MIRSPNPAPGKYEVTFVYLDSFGQPVDDEYIADIGPFAPVIGGNGEVLEDVPRVSNKKPYKGDLAQEELDWLQRLPGRVYSAHRRYTVKKVK